MRDWTDRLLAQAYWPVIGLSILLSLIALAAAAGAVPNLVVKLVGWSAVIPCVLLFVVKVIDPAGWRPVYGAKDIPTSFNFFPRLFAAKDGNRLMLAVVVGLWLELVLIAFWNLKAAILVFEAFWLVGAWLHIKFQRLVKDEPLAT